MTWGRVWSGAKQDIEEGQSRKTADRMGSTVAILRLSASLSCCEIYPLARSVTSGIH